jgi:butyrate kinase
MATELVISQPQMMTSRRFRRYKLDVPVRVVVHTDEKTRIIDGRGTELNEGGMAVQAGVELELGDTVEVEFTPAYTGEPLRARAEVRNRSGYRYGFAFLLETPDDCDRVMDIRVALQGVGKAM